MRRRDACAALAWPLLGASQAQAQAQTAGRSTPTPWPARRATPAVALPTHEGPLWRLADVRGKPVLLNFWASWCEPCRSEMPTLELLATRYEAQGLQVMAVNFRETDAAVQRGLQAWPISLTILRDREGALAQAYGVRTFPTTVGFNRQGQAAFVWVGEADWNAEPARSWVAALL